MKKITCIIVDDEKEARDRAEDLLKMFKEIRIIAKEGDTDIAIKKIIQQKPDIVFLDIEMPGKNGFDIVNEIKENNISPKFIFVTGHSQYTIKAIRNAAFDYLLKPIDIDDLKETIERYKNSKKIDISYETNGVKKVKIVDLSEREKEIIRLIIKGKTSKEISELLFISKNTVDTHRRNILEKTGLKSTNELICFVIKKGLV
ncbi:MAG: response regulator transcription factor [Bacteroidales bacterium]|nr:response regulator transcription factor [Bacteroidales bacterium]